MVNTFMAGFVGSPAMNQTPRYRAQGGPEILEMERFWHAHTMWHDPSGIGTGRGIKGFCDWPQNPFLNAMPDRA